MVAFSLFLLLSLLPVATALAEPTFATDNFKAKWQRADKPVADGNANPQRSWLWGPESFNPPTGQTEPYAESPGGSRQVQYFDKARMELNDPATGAVTNGLLVKELISGKLATGDRSTIARRPADDIPVAGDPANNEGPTYASFIKVASLNNDNPSTDKTGQVANNYIERDGTVSTNDDPDNPVKYVYFDQTLKHNIPNVFWDFMNQKGNVFTNGKLVANQPVLGDNQFAPWLDAMGLPLTEAYWTEATIGGQPKGVLIQAFERRVLTYTPDNDPPFQVEMGNVGRHYYSWRYNSKYDAPATGQPGDGTTPTNPPASGPKSCAELTTTGTNGAFALTKCGPAGMEMAVAAPMQPNELVTAEVVDPNGDTYTSQTFQAAGEGTVIAKTSTSQDVVQGLWTFKLKGQISGKTAEAYVWLSPPVTTPVIIVYPDPGKLNQRISFALVGFAPNQNMQVKIKTPKDWVGSFPGSGSIVTSDGGSVTLILVPSTDIKPSGIAVAGDWFMSAEEVLDEGGLNHYTTINFKLTN
jgi:hypothetical protein